MEKTISQTGYSIDLSKSIKNNKLNFSMLLQGKLISTPWALGKSTLHRRWTVGTSKDSSISYFKGEPAFWTTQHMLQSRNHFRSLSLIQLYSKILKTFLKALKIVTIKSLLIPKTIKYYVLKYATLFIEKPSVCEDDV